MEDDFRLGHWQMTFSFFISFLNLDKLVNPHYDRPVDTAVRTLLAIFEIGFKHFKFVNGTLSKVKSFNCLLNSSKI